MPVTDFFLCSTTFPTNGKHESSFKLHPVYLLSANALNLYESRSLSFAED